MTLLFLFNKKPSHAEAKQSVMTEDTKNDPEQKIIVVCYW